jgi:hypothetical protein
MKKSYDCDCGVCSICNGTRKPFPPQPPGTKKWQHEDTGYTTDMPIGENPGKRWYPISDK